MNDQIAQQIADQLSLIAKALEVQNEHLRSLDLEFGNIRDEINYVGQSVVGLHDEISKGKGEGD
jgi:hypothetical protein